LAIFDQHLAFSIIAACSKDASSALDWWVTAGRRHWTD